MIYKFIWMVLLASSGRLRQAYCQFKYLFENPNQSDQVTQGVKLRLIGLVSFSPVVDTETTLFSPFFWFFKMTEFDHFVFAVKTHW